MIEKILSIGEKIISMLFSHKEKRASAIDFYRKQVRKFESDDSPARAKEAFEQLATDQKNKKKPE